MTKKAKQSKKAAKGSKWAKVLAQREDEPDTATTTSPAEGPQATPATPEVEIAVESQQSVAVAPLATLGIPETEVVTELQQAEAVPAPTAPATSSEASPKATRSEAARANIKEGLRLHQIAGRPTKAQLVLVFGKAGYLLTWPKRTEKFGITPETFQAALAKGIQARPLVPVAEQSKKS